MNGLEDQVAANYTQVAKPNDQHEPKWDIPEQRQHDVSCDDQHLIGNWIENCP